MYDCKFCRHSLRSRTYVFPPIHDFKANIKVQVQVSVEIGDGVIGQVHAFVKVDEFAPDC